ncbi:MAG TPA: sensor domain-containing diguanylate cyclase [Candidatus Elarobacter sp.]|nr:sensor domain-containing diguanylate cyclase [Candidatus Elarobacter sp.]
MTTSADELPRMRTFDPERGGRPRPRPFLFDERPVGENPSVLGAVAGFIVIVCLLIAGLTVLEIADRRGSETHVFEQQSLNVARSLAQQSTDGLETVDAVLLDLGDRMQASGVGPAELSALHRIIRTDVHELPILHNVFVIGPHGDRLTDALPFKKLNVADREWFVFTRTHPAADTYVGPTVRSRIDGSWIITVSRRVNRRDGSFAGAVVATISAKYFEDLYAGVDVGRSGTITLMRRDGRIVVRKPFTDAVLGRTFSRSAWFRAIPPNAASGFASGRSAIDNVARYFSYARVKRYPLLVLVGMSQNEVLGEWRLETWIDVAEVAGVLLVLIVIGIYLIRQIRVREAAERELSRFALIDGLTGLGNRRYLDDVLEREWLRAMRARASISFLMIDADHFKAYNDHYGHRAGDRVLKTIAACIAAAISRAEDCALRYGGEEFAVLLPGTDEAGAHRVAETIRVAICALQIVHVSPPGFMTVSVGVASLCPARGSSSGTIVEAADAALYEAKRDGRNRTAIASLAAPAASASA